MENILRYVIIIYACIILGSYNITMIVFEIKQEHPRYHVVAWSLANSVALYMLGSSILSNL